MTGDSVRTAAKRLLGGVGHLLHRAVGMVPAWSFVLSRLKGLGFQPKTVIDIGVARGTPELYAAFPDAHYYLVDPTRESLPYMQAIARRLDAQVLNVALGEQEGELEIGVRPDDIGGSTFFEEIGPIGQVHRYAVPVKRFDSAIDGFERPALCKIDVQGAELSVLRGMGERLHELDAVIVETSVLATIRDGPEIADVIGYLKQQGWVLYDLLGGGRRPLDRALAQLDLLFIPEDSPLRADRRWYGRA